MRSDVVTKGMQSAPQRSLFNDLGMTKEELNKCKATSIGALIQEGKTTNIYYKNLIVGKTTYVTLRKSIS